MNSFNINYKNLMKKGFTMAENLVVLVVLGVILAIAVPGLINDKNKKTNQAIVKRAVTKYDSILNMEKIRATGIRNTNAFNAILSQNGCDKIKMHFSEISRIDNENHCIFTSENVIWNATIPSEVVIALNGERPTAANAKDADNMKVFYISYLIHNGRISLLTKTDSWGGTNFAEKTRNFIIGE